MATEKQYVRKLTSHGGQVYSIWFRENESDSDTAPEAVPPVDTWRVCPGHARTQPIAGQVVPRTHPEAGQAADAAP